MASTRSQGSNRDERWSVPYRIVKSSNQYFVQVEFVAAGTWNTLSEMQNNGHSYHFVQYRRWDTIKDILKWWKKVERTKILNSSMWMPSEAITDIELVSDYKQIKEDYPELII